MVLEAPILTAPEVRTVVVQAVRVASRTLGLVPRRAEAMAPGMPMVARSQPSRSRPLLPPTHWVRLKRFEEPTFATATTTAMLRACLAPSFFWRCYELAYKC